MKKCIASNILMTIVVIISFLSIGQVLATNGTWTNPSGGSWVNTANWSGGVIADGTDALADFSTLDLTAGATVTLDGARTNGSLTFGDTTPSHNWTLNTGSGGPLTLAVSSGAPAITVNNQSATLGVTLAGTQGLNKLGTGTLALTGANTYSGTTIITNGVLTYSGSGSYAPTTASLIKIGGATGRGVFNMNSSGAVNFTSGTDGFRIGGDGGTGDTGVGALNQTAGTLNLISGASIYLQIGFNGSSGSAYGSVNQSGGTLTVTSGSGIRLGYQGMGSWMQSGGTLNCGRYFVIGGGNVNGNGVATFTGGSATVNSAQRIHLSDNAACKGTLNIGTEAGGSASVTTLASPGLYIVAVSGGNTALNLNSGTLTLGGPITMAASGTAALNLNGGTLKAGANNITLVNNANGLVGNLYNGGVIVDNQANTATISVKLLGTAGNGVYPAGGVFAISSGGGSGYIGAPLVTVSGGSGSGALAIANVSGGVVTGVTMTCPGQNYAAGDTLTFTFAGGGYTNAASTFNYVLTSNDISPNVLGGLTKLGTGTLNLATNSTYTGTTLVNAGTLNIMADSGLGLGNVKVVNGASLRLSGGVTNGYIATTANLALESSAIANLNFTGTNTVNGLSVDGGLTYVAVGTYGSSSSPAANHDDTHFTGTGVINVTAQPAGATVALTSSLNPSEYTQSVTFTATVNGSSGTPTGTVSFKDGSVTLSTVALDGSGVAAYTTAALVIGTHNITAVYNGNGTYSSASSSLLPQIISPRNDIWNAAINNVWDINTTGNWLDLASQAVYHDGDAVQFDDTATGSTDISLAATVAPSSLIVTNAGKNYSFSGAAISGATGLAKFGSGSLTISNANSYVGNTFIQGGVVNYNGTGASSGNGNLSVSNGVVNIGSSGTFNFSGNTSVGGIAGNGNDTGSGAINQNNGTVNLSVDSTYLELGAGDTNATPGSYTSYGSYILSGGTLNTLGGAGVRVGASGMGTFRQTGGTLYCDRWFAIGTASGGSGIGGGLGEATFTGGTVGLNSGRRIIVGDKPNSTGVFNLGTLAGGTAVITLPYNSGGKGGLEFIDSVGALSGTANLNSGTLTLAGSIYRNSTLGEIVNINFNGGVIAANNNMTLVDSAIYSATLFKGGLVVDTQGHTVTNSASLQAAYDNGIYPAGGSLAVASGGGSGYIGAPLVTVSGGSGYGAMAIANISGGVVTSITMTCPGQSYQSGDTVNFNFTGGGAATPASTFSYTLQAGDVAPNNGGVTKLGAGTLVLNGYNSFTGPTVVGGGTLLLNTSYANGTGDYIVTNAGTLNVVIASAGSQLAMNNLAFADPVSSTLTLDLSAAGSIAAAPISASGSLDVEGVTTINVLIGGLAAGEYPLIQYGSLGGAGGFVLGSLPVGMQAHLATNTLTSPNSIDLVVTSAGQPRWDGQVGGNPNGTWDINATANWVDALTFQPETYKDGLPVLFDDNASGTTTVNLTTNVHPGNVTFNNNSLTYTLTGTNKISGSTGLTVQGSGTVNIQNVNDYTGTTVIGGGTLNITNLPNGGLPSPIGASSSDSANLVFAGGTLDYSGPAAATDRGYSVQSGGAIDTESDLALSGVVTAPGAGGFTKKGVAQLAYTTVGSNVLSGAGSSGYAVQEGKLLFDGSAGAQINVIQGDALSVGGAANSTAVLTNTTVTTSSDTAVGNVAGTTGTLTVNGGSTLNVGSWFTLGDGANSTATFNLNGGTVNVNNGRFFMCSAPGTMTTLNINAGVFNKNSTNPFVVVDGNWNGAGARTGIVNQVGGTVESASEIWISQTTNGTGIYNLNNGVINLHNWLAVGRQGGVGVFNMNGGVLNKDSNGQLDVGTGGGIGVFTQNGGTINNQNRLYCPEDVGSTGTNILHGGTNNVSDYIVIGRGGVGNLSMDGGVINKGSANQFLVGDNSGTGTVDFSGGIINITSPARLVLGNNGGATGTLTQSGGIINCGSRFICASGGGTGTYILHAGTNVVPDYFVIGNGTGGNGIVTMDGGVINKGSINRFIVGDGGTGTLNFSGGTITSDGEFWVGNGGGIGTNNVSGVAVLNAHANFIVGNGGTGVVNQNGGTVNATGSFVYLGTGIAAGTWNLNGGIVTANEITAGGTGISTFNLNGGTLHANVNNTNFLHALTAAYVMANGAVIDSGSSAVSIAQPLLDGGGNGGLTKLGSGALYLNGANTFTGVTVVSNGIFGGTGSIAGSLHVVSGATLAPGTSIGALTVGGAATLDSGSTTVMELNKTAGTNDQLMVSGGLTYGGTLVLKNLGGQLAANDTFTLFPTPGTGSFTIQSITPGQIVTWDTSQLAVNGTIRVVGVTSVPVSVTPTVNGSNLTLTWPADQTGWTLEMQTNSLAVGISTNWIPVAGSSATNQITIPINPAINTTFFRLVF